MRALVQRGRGAEGLTVSEIPTPKLRANEVLVRVRAASVNAADWHFLKPVPRFFARFLGEGRSAAIGRDMAGIVERVGEDVAGLRAGDAVFGCAAGAFAEQVAARAPLLAAKPERIGFEAAAALPTAGCTALQAVRDHARVAAGDRVLVYGAGGGVGSMAVQIAKALGAHVTAATRRDHVEAVRTLGADEILDYARQDPLDGRARYDAILDTSAGRPAAERTRALRPGGRVVQIGAADDLAKQIGGMFQGSARGGPRAITFMGRVHAADLAALASMCEKGRLTPLIDRTCTLETAPAAVHGMGAHTARGKIVIAIGPTADAP